MTPTPVPLAVPVDDLARLVAGQHGSPHDILGPHPYNKQVTIRTLRPMAKAITIVSGADKGRDDP